VVSFIKPEYPTVTLKEIGYNNKFEENIQKCNT
jgi:hypothetical protein